jgi:hypothetical protein
MKILSRRMMVISVMSAAFLALLAGTGWAQTSNPEPPKPNYSGTWKLNLAKSNFGGGTVPKSGTEVITQSGSSLMVAVTSQQNETLVMKYNVSATIGAPAVGIDRRHLPPDDIMKVQDIKAEWNDDALVVTMNALLNKEQVTIKSTYTLSPDGKTLTKAVNVDIDSGMYDNTEIYEKS